MIKAHKITQAIIENLTLRFISNKSEYTQNFNLFICRGFAANLL